MEKLSASKIPKVRLALATQRESYSEARLICVCVCVCVFVCVELPTNKFVVLLEPCLAQGVDCTNMAVGNFSNHNKPSVTLRPTHPVLASQGSSMVM